VYSLSKIQSKVPETLGMGNPRGNPNRIKYQSYTGVWVNYTVKNNILMLSETLLTEGFSLLRTYR